MIYRLLQILSVFMLLFITSGAALALPKCKGSPASGFYSYSKAKNWDSCIGDYEWKGFYINGKVMSHRLFGVFKRGKLNGHGFKTSCNFSVNKCSTWEGPFKNGKIGEPFKVHTGKQVKDIKVDYALFSNSTKPPATALRTAFNLLSLDRRKEIQKTLKALQFYSYSIDGLYGKGTQTALTEYNKKYLGAVELKNPKNVTTLINAITKQKMSSGEIPQPHPETVTFEGPHKTKLMPQITTSDIEPVTVPEPKPAPVIVKVPDTKPNKPPQRNIGQEFGLNFYGSFLHTKDVSNALFLFGDISKSDSFEFRKAMRNHEIDLIILSSPGGLVWEGLSIAGIIHDKELDTYVPQNSLTQKGNCASACSFMFFAGANRSVNGKLGVHQFYASDSTKEAKIGDTQQNAQFTVSEIIGFLNEFETPPWVFERMFQQSEMYYFKESELLQLETETTELQRAAYGRVEAFISELRIAYEETKNHVD